MTHVTISLAFKMDTCHKTKHCHLVANTSGSNHAKSNQCYGNHS